MIRLWALVCLGVLVIVCTYWRVQYLDEVTGGATQEDIRQKFGPPMEERNLDTGESVWLYQFTGHGIMIHANKWCEGYELRFNAQKVLSQWNHNYC